MSGGRWVGGLVGWCVCVVSVCCVCVVRGLYVWCVCLVCGWRQYQNLSCGSCSTDSTFSFVQFLEKLLNPADEQRPWMLLLDCASVHTASAFRQQLHSQLPWVKEYLNPRRQHRIQSTPRQVHDEKFQECHRPQVQPPLCRAYLVGGFVGPFSSLLGTRH